MKLGIPHFSPYGEKMVNRSNLKKEIKEKITKHRPK